MKALPNQATKSKKPTLLPKVPKVSFRVPLSNITNVQRTATNLEQKKTTTRPTSKVPTASKHASSTTLATFESLQQPLPTLRSTVTTTLDTKDLTSQSTNFIPFDINEPMLVEDVMLIDEVVEDIDALDRDDPLSVTEYVNDIYAVLREREKQFRIPADYMKEQFDINERMRMILLDWLVEVHLKFRLLTDTLHLAVYIIDRYLSLKQIIRDELQLVGITAMLLASKYEEIYIPECGDFIYICDNAYTKEQLLDKERDILSTLSFRLTVPSSLLFLRRFTKAAHGDCVSHTLGKYLLEVCFMHTKMLKFLPSQLAAASVWLSRSMLKITPVWTKTLEHYTTFTEESVKAVAYEVNEFVKSFRKLNSFKAIEKKYSSDKLGRVACIPLLDFEHETK